MKRIFSLFIMLAMCYVPASAQNCNNQDDYTALRTLFLNSNGDDWTNQMNAVDEWPNFAFFQVNDAIPENNDMSSWYGVTCVDGRVTELTLNNNNLDGIIPEELGLLSELTMLDLKENNLEDNIPASLGDLSNLVELNLRDNALTGEIPEELGELEQLEVLRLRGNLLTGSIPEELGDLSALRILNLRSNMLSGTIPASLGELTNLITLRLTGNELEGEIPEELGDLSSLENLYLNDNNLEGFIPNALTSLTSLTTLRLDNNSLVGCPDATLASFLCNLGTYNGSGNTDLADICDPNYEPSGTVCDDNDTSTENDIIREDCECRGDCTEPFTPVCNDPTIGVSILPEEIPGWRLLGDISGTCGFRYTTQVRRMAPGQGPDENWGESIILDCDDLPTGEVIYELRAVDINGKISGMCMNTITLQDKTPPVVEDPLNDITISCSRFSLFQSLADEDYNIFGTYVIAPNPQLFFDYDLDGDGTLDYGYLTGLVSDACMDENGISVDVDMSGINDCGYGEIVRTFTFTDVSGNSVMQVQTITIEQDDLFDPATDVEWPGMYVHNSCQVPEPSVSGEPNILEQGCSKMLITHHDELFIHPEGGCDKIVRTWVLLDCCHPEELPVGRYEREQIIQLKDETRPVFDAGVCDPYEFDITSNTCETLVTLSVSATDECSTDVLTYTYELSVDGGAYGPAVEAARFNQVVPVGNHSLRWTVTDKCGNSAQCVQPVTINDAKPPVFYVIDGLVTTIMEMQNGNQTTYMAMIEADMFVTNIFTDNCTASEDIAFSFSSDKTDNVRIFNCDDVGPQVVTIYGTDLSGNQISMTTNLTVVGDVCPSGNKPGSISGSVVTSGSTPIQGVNMRLYAPENIVDSYTQVDGSFAFENLPLGSDYMVKVDHESSHRDGVSTIDLVKIQQHILGLNVFDDPYLVLASDVDGSETVSPLDLLEIRKIILGVEKEFSGGKSWRYVDGNETYIDPLNPWAAVEEYNVNDLTGDMNDVNFVAVKMGDVNGSMEHLLIDQAEPRSSNYLDLNASYNASGVDVIAMEDNSLYGLQFTMPLNNDHVELSSSIINIDESNYHIDNGLLTFAWASAEPIDLNGGETLFTVSGTDQVRFNSRITEALAYNDREERLTLRWVDGQSSIFEVTQNSPNPFIHATAVEVEMPAAATATFVASDVQGRKIATVQRALSSGNNSVVVDFIPEGYNGMVLLQVRTDYGIRSIKMVKLR